MKKINLLIVFIFLISATFSQEINQDYIKEHYTKIERYISMRDGVKLFTSIYIPKDQSQKYPILLNRTPYTVAPYGEDKYKNSLGNFPAMAKQGYIFVYQDVRGKWMSEGTFENIRPTKTKENKLQIDESTDTYDTIDWLIKNIRNNNGRVGMYGISYPGFYATASLINSHPALKAVSPQAPVTDWFVGDDFRHGGALMLMDAFRFMYTFDAPRPVPTTDATRPKPFELKTKDYYKFFLQQNSIKNLQANYLNHTVKFWNDLYKHQILDTFWTNRDITSHLNQVKPAVMIVGGMFDAEDVYGTFQTYKQIEKANPNTKNILVIGPWYHGGWVRSDGDSFGDIRFDEKTSLYYQNKIELPFFEYYLKNKGTFTPAEATVYITGSNQWKQFSTWPPKDVIQKTLFIHTDNTLTYGPRDTKDTYIEYVSDPNKPVPFQNGVITDRTREYMIADQRFVTNRPDVISFSTETLQNNLTVVGPIIVDLKVSMTGTDADFVVKVIDIYPDTSTTTSPISPKTIMNGYQMLVRAEVLRGRFREGFNREEPFVSNEITTVQLTLPDVAHTFLKGHTLMIQVQHTWFPLIDRNPNQMINTFDATKDDFIKNTHRIYEGSTINIGTITL